MTKPSAPSVAAQPLVVVADVEKSSRFYARILGATSAHGGPEYERLVADGRLILQLHALDEDHHHGALADPSRPRGGNGVALWFEMADFDAAVRRVREVGATIVTDVHDNPNARHRELWLRDLDGYLVVLAGK
jgi:predicted enzyme related to lactoylglutathione lyase